ncbi:mannosyl-3-phosphoglycerate synthase [Natronosporangium hydrolyticum]|uniref:Mannosyl-3-phosphoglycerate synthase n=1 Tax=Natronosporangium hydrolyticum TaxID=2811111 RepID=A0A895Y7B0_9ACTN|nr:mannosyl-3-phosphoglycerate synthase [Natronosporangium hydrolyticum]QSB13607.1 mannosyl-3-phosphoglycerate synthase [Natronosporangium hydrolyticum]
MRLERPHRTERFGAVRIHELQRVIELDSGDAAMAGPRSRESLRVPSAQLRAIEQDMVIVVPCMNETRRVIEGVLSGVPHDCLVIMVSNSARGPVDRYEIEAQTVEQFCQAAERPAITVHQRDPGLAAAVKAAGAADLIDDEGLVRGGKGEAMFVGLAMAALTGRRYLGFIDADNFVPGAVNEYCKAYAAAFQLADSPYSMVRISWHSKPKLRDGRLFFSRRGRTSEVTNQFLNQLIGEYSGFGTEVVATGNAGEHAFSLQLGLKLRLAGGFAVEPYEYLDMFEQFGGVLDSPHQEVLDKSVSVSQIETRNPHFHDNKGDHHVQDMRMQALNVLYHSPVCLPSVRSEILDFMLAHRAIGEGDEPPRERIYPPVGTLALDRFCDMLTTEAHSLRQVPSDGGDGLSYAPQLSRWPRH